MSSLDPFARYDDTPELQEIAHRCISHAGYLRRDAENPNPFTPAVTANADDIPWPSLNALIATDKTHAASATERVQEIMNFRNGNYPFKEVEEQYKGVGLACAQGRLVNQPTCSTPEQDADADVLFLLGIDYSGPKYAAAHLKKMGSPIPDIQNKKVIVHSYAVGGSERAAHVNACLNEDFDEPVNHREIDAIIDKYILPRLEKQPMKPLLLYTHSHGGAVAALIERKLMNKESALTPEQKQLLAKNLRILSLSFPLIMRQASDDHTPRIPTTCCLAADDILPPKANYLAGMYLSPELTCKQGFNALADPDHPQRNFFFFPHGVMPVQAGEKNINVCGHDPACLAELLRPGGEGFSAVSNFISAFADNKITDWQKAGQSIMAQPLEVKKFTQVVEAVNAQEAQNQQRRLGNSDLYKNVDSWSGVAHQDKKQMVDKQSFHIQEELKAWFSSRNKHPMIHARSKGQTGTPPLSRP